MRQICKYRRRIEGRGSGVVVIGEKCAGIDFFSPYFVVVCFFSDILFCSQFEEREKSREQLVVVFKKK